MWGRKQHNKETEPDNATNEQLNVVLGNNEADNVPPTPQSVATLTDSKIYNNDDGDAQTDTELATGVEAGGDDNNQALAESQETYLNPYIGNYNNVDNTNTTNPDIDVNTFYPPSFLQRSLNNFVNTDDLTLDGKSLLLPENFGLGMYGDGDEVSSINSSLHYGGNSRMKIMGTTVQDGDEFYNNNNLNRSGSSDNDKVNTTSNSKGSTEFSSMPLQALGENSSNGSGSNTKKKGIYSCWPEWVQHAPYWLKLLLVASMILLIAAISLVAIGIVIALQSSSIEQENSTAVGNSLVSGYGELSFGSSNSALDSSGGGMSSLDMQDAQTYLQTPTTSKADPGIQVVIDKPTTPTRTTNATIVFPTDSSEQVKNETVSIIEVALPEDSTNNNEVLNVLVENMAVPNNETNNTGLVVAEEEFINEVIESVIEDIEQQDTSPTTETPSLSPTNSPSTAFITDMPTAATPIEVSAQVETTPSPTESPTTAAPTPFPTLSPTEITSSPTIATASPIVATASPTLEPSSLPTSQPSFRAVKATKTSKPTASPTPSPTALPTMSPSAKPTGGPTTNPTGGPTTNPTGGPTTSPTGGPTAGPTGGPTAGPTTSPTGGPTSPPTANPTPSPTEMSFDDTVSFWVMSGRLTGDTLETARRELQSLDTFDNNAFLVHLGDWNSPAETECSRQSYNDIDQLFSTASVPVYFVPGDNEYNDCPNPEQAIEEWRDTLVDYEERYRPEPNWRTWRDDDKDFPENWVFRSQGVVFCGVNVVGGLVHDEEEWSERLASNLDWIRSNYYYYRRSRSTMVIFMHDTPSEDADNAFSQDNFFIPLFAQIREDFADMNFIIVHRNFVSETVGLEREYNGIRNLNVVTVEGALWPPMQITLQPDNGQIRISQEDELQIDRSEPDELMPQAIEGPGPIESERGRTKNAPDDL